MPEKPDQHLKWSPKQNCGSFQGTLILDRLAKLVSDALLLYVPVILLCSSNKGAAACLVSLFCHTGVKRAGYRMTEGREGGICGGLHRSPTKEGTGHVGGMSGGWVISTFWHGWEGGKGMSSGVLELSKNESTNSFKHGWEKTTWEEKQQLRQPRAALAAGTQGCAPGDRATCDCPVPWCQNYWGCEHRQGTTQRHLCKALLGAPQLSHGKYENSTHSHKSAKCLIKLVSPLSFS